MATRKTKRRVVTRADFVGTKMANLLFSLKSNPVLPQSTRDEAKKLQEQWDSVCVFRLNNPIVAAELEKAFAAGELK